MARQRFRAKAVWSAVPNRRVPHADRSASLPLLSSTLTGKRHTRLAVPRSWMRHLGLARVLVFLPTRAV